jgi:hypothetical protein
MANTYTTNYSLTKSEVGGDNQNWGTNLHTSLNEIDGQLVNKLDKDVVKGFTSTAIIFTNTGSATGTISAASGDLFQDFEINDKVRVTGATSATNGSDASPSIHTVTSKGSSNSITVSTGLVTASAGDSVDIALVFEPSYSDIGAGEIDGTPIGANSASTGAFTTISASSNGTVSGNLSVEGNSSVEGNTTLGNASTDTVTSNAKHGATTFTGQITSEVTDGTAPMVVTSTTSVANLKASKADAWSTGRSITLSGDCTGTVTGVTGSGDIAITTVVGGLVKFKAGIDDTSLPTPSPSAPGAGKTYVAYGAWSGYFGTARRQGNAFAYMSNTSETWTEVTPPGGTSIEINWSHYVLMDNA